MSDGTVNVGAVLSLTVIIWSCVVEFPAQSVTFHVRVIVHEPGHEPAIVASECVVNRFNTAVQLSARLLGEPVIVESASYAHIPLV